ncbi:uncharacterized protein LOC8069179 [Sorghum bicolor]|uniref:DUF6598 domain-containing protein n=1 Tax=Sorghum bicolor TaxID=4558 RepID=C5Z4G1_SORBI|nr:uncharacterized protein LOC8069179 [Sorghum bicolor]EER89234.1 hypothetical protein SORBI_3010G046500 [Sorghum bicolor]|eukprot:XP_002437867.1 uncharacterized protein LOC8069179 [Sorghum bicolor]
MEEPRFEEEEEPEDYEIALFRKEWDLCYAADYGPLEATTVRPMRYTFRPIPKHATREIGLQIFSVKVAKPKEDEDLHWPLHVYGLIATRDSADLRRNLVFNRTRDNCQILTQEDPFLLLTGPSRSVVLIDPVIFEIQLKAKCETESEDKVLNFRVLGYKQNTNFQEPPFIDKMFSHCKRSKLEFAVALLFESIEATIVVRVFQGSWPDHLRGRVVSRTASISHGDIVLLDSRDGRMPIGDWGDVSLPRCVVSVESEGQLKVDVVASHVDDDNNVVAKDVVDFRPKMAGVSHGICDLGFCKMKISVLWSLPCYVGEEVGLQNRP